MNKLEALKAQVQVAAKLVVTRRGKQPETWVNMRQEDFDLLAAVAAAALPLLEGNGAVLRVNADGYEDIWYECPFCHYRAWPGQRFLHGEGCKWEAFAAVAIPLQQEV